MSFYDRSYTGNTLVDLTYATSSDGGATWRRRSVTSREGFDPSAVGRAVGSQASGPFIGDYNGIASTNTFAAMTWTVWLRRSRSTSRSTSPRRRRSGDDGCLAPRKRRQAPLSVEVDVDQQRRETAHERHRGYATTGRAPQRAEAEQEHRENAVANTPEPASSKLTGKTTPGASTKKSPPV